MGSVTLTLIAIYLPLSFRGSGYGWVCEHAVERMVDMFKPSFFSLTWLYAEGVGAWLPFAF